MAPELALALEHPTLRDQRVSKAGRANACWLGACCAALLCWGGCGAPAFAQTDFGLGYTLTHDSNVKRSETAPQSDYTEQFFAGLTYNERSADLTARVVAQAERRHFVRNSFDDDTGFFFDGLGVWTISPRFFTWTVQDVHRELNSNPRDPATPATLQKTNSFSTGPDFSFRWDAANTPVIGARYGRFRVYGAESGPAPGDSDRYALYAQWLHQISTPSVLSLNSAATRINFDPQALYTKISREDAFLRYDYSQLTVRQTADVGATRMAQSGGQIGAQNYSGRLLRYFAQWARTSQSALRIFLADQISDTYSDMIPDFSVPTLPSIRGEAAAAPLTVSSFFQPDIYHSRRSEFTYTTQSEFFLYSLQGHLRNVDYKTLDQDYKEKGARASVSWLFSIETQAYAYTQYVKRVFLSNDERDADRDMAVGLLYQLSRSSSLRLEAGRQERNSNLQNTGQSSGPSFVDRRVMLVLGYSTGTLFSPQSRR